MSAYSAGWNLNHLRKMKFIPQTLVILLFAVSLRAVAIEGNIELKFAGSGLPIA